MSFAEAELEGRILGRMERLPVDWSDIDPVLDEDVILKGSLAEWGYRLSDGSMGEVFLWEGRHGSPTTLEVYPLDGRDTPVAISMNGFGYTNGEVLQAVNTAYMVLSQNREAA
jgi:hypothetical protein